MQFQSITGHKETKEQLVQMVQHNRLSHALLFLGKEGSGALQLALAFAQYITCDKVNGRQTTKPAEPSLFGDPEPHTTNLKQQTTNDSCGICPACKKAAEFIHPDIHFSYPVIPSKPGDKPISADYIKEWREFIKQQPYGNVYDWLQFIEAENKQGNITSEECNDIIMGADPGPLPVQSRAVRPDCGGREVWELTDRSRSREREGARLDWLPRGTGRRRGPMQA